MKKMTTDNTSPTLILTVLGTVAVVAGAAWAGPQETTKQGFAWRDGAEVYGKICALCHETSVGPMLRGRSLDPMYIKFMVRHGNRAMPAFRASEIDDQSLELLAEYLSRAEANK